MMPKVAPTIISTSSSPNRAAALEGSPTEVAVFAARARAVWVPSKES
jgi:hypothetical protein